MITLTEALLLWAATFALVAPSLAHPVTADTARSSRLQPRLSRLSDDQIHTLFKRQSLPALNGTSITYPTEDVKGPTPLAAWVTAYNAAKSANLIPSYPPSTMNTAGVTYPAGAGDPTGVLPSLDRVQTVELLRVPRRRGLFLFRDSCLPSQTPTDYAHGRRANATLQTTSSTRLMAWFP